MAKTVQRINKIYEARADGHLIFKFPFDLRGCLSVADLLADGWELLDPVAGEITDMEVAL